MPITPPVDPQRAAQVAAFFRQQRTAPAGAGFDALSDLLNRQAATRQAVRAAFPSARSAASNQALQQALFGGPAALGRGSAGAGALVPATPGLPATVGTAGSAAGTVPLALPAGPSPLALGPGSAAGLPAAVAPTPAAIGPAASAAANTAASTMTGPQAMEALGANAARTASTAPSIAGAVAGEAGSVGGAAATAGRFAPTLGRAALMRGAGLAGAGIMAGQLTGSLFDTEQSYVDEALSGALTGAGIGAGIGSIVPGIGTGIGAGVGALAGGAIGYFGPKQTGTKAVASETQAQQANLDELLGKYNLSPALQQQLAVQLDTALNGVTSKAEVKAIYQQVGSLLPGLIQQDQAQQQDAARAAAIYSMLGPIMQQQNTQATQASREMQTAMNSAAQHISDPALANIYRARASQVPLTTAQSNQNQLLQLALADAAYSSQAQQAQAAPTASDPLAALLAGGQ